MKTASSTVTIYAQTAVISLGAANEPQKYAQRPRALAIASRLQSGLKEVDVRERKTIQIADGRIRSLKPHRSKLLKTIAAWGGTNYVAQLGSLQECIEALQGRSVGMV